MRQGRAVSTDPGAMGAGSGMKFHHSRAAMAEEAGRCWPQSISPVSEAFVAGLIPDILGRLIVPEPGAANARRPLDALIDALVADDAAACAAIVDLFLDDDPDPQHLVEALLAPAARRIGEMWVRDECDFLVVTIATSRLQRLFNAAARAVPAPIATRSGCVALLSPAPGEEHAFGLSVVEDALCRAGWSVDCCAHGNEEELVERAASCDYGFIGLSVGGERLLPRLSSTIGRVRRASLNVDVAIVGGGNVFASNPAFGDSAGFDAVAKDARSAVRIAERIVRNMPARQDSRRSGA